MKRSGLFLVFLFALSQSSFAAPRKPRVVALGAAKKVAYSQAGDPAGAQPGERELLIRALTVDGALKEWTTGPVHEITDRSFVVRRALKVNDLLPEEKSTKKIAGAVSPWVWQRGPWLLVDRATGRITALRLPDYDPGVSQVAWFRDYAAYCGLAESGKRLYAVVAQVGGRKPVLAKTFGAYDAEHPQQPVCQPPVWRRDPLGVTFFPAGREAASYGIAPGSAVLVEENAEEEPAAQ